MNPLTNVKNIGKLNETELSRGMVNKKSSWHEMYKDSAWIFIGGLAYGLTEGDVISVFSQYGETVNINLVRDKKTGKTQGFCFLCYANQKSTILAVDNLNGIKLCNRTIRVDHVANYKPPKENEKDDEVTRMLKTEGCAPRKIKIEPSSSEDEPIEKISKRIKKERTSSNKNEEFLAKHVRVKKESRWESVNDHSKKTSVGHDKHDKSKVGDKMFDFNCEDSDSDDPSRMRKDHSSKSKNFHRNETVRKRTYSPESKYKEDSFRDRNQVTHKKHSKKANSDSKGISRNNDTSTSKITLDEEYKEQQSSAHKRGRKTSQVNSSSEESSSDSCSESDSDSSSESSSSSSSNDNYSDNYVVKKPKKKHGADKKKTETQSKNRGANSKYGSDNDNSVVEKLKKKYGGKEKSSKSHSRSHDTNNKYENHSDSDNLVVENMRKKHGNKEEKTCRRSHGNDNKYESGSDFDNSVVETLRSKYGGNDKKNKTASIHDATIDKNQRGSDSDKSMANKLREKYSKSVSKLKSSVSGSGSYDNEYFEKSKPKQLSSDRDIYQDHYKHQDRSEKVDKYGNHFSKYDQSGRRH